MKEKMILVTVNHILRNNNQTFNSLKRKMLTFGLQMQRKKVLLHNRLVSKILISTIPVAIKPNISQPQTTIKTLSLILEIKIKVKVSPRNNNQIWSLILMSIIKHKKVKAHLIKIKIKSRLKNRINLLSMTTK